MASSDKGRMYLTDDPIDSEDEDSFGHIEYVDSLSETILNVDPPWHIGIFGEWGSGKSSIINLLDNRIENETEFDNILCIEFDAWAHAEDSVRTELLLELDQKIGQEINGEDSDGVLGEDEITGRLYDVQEEEKVSKPNDAKEIITSFWNDSPVLVISFVLIGIVAALLEYEGHSTLASVAVTGLLLPVLGYILQQLDTVAQTIQRKFLYPRKEWTGAYQRIFDSIIEEANAEKIVISVDNLDRCESETAYEVLVSLKTFLENDSCIYLIPCDDEALESHLNAINEDDYFGDTRNEREFLRKFFQTHIRIPPFQTEDVEEYAQEQNQELRESFDRETVDIVANAYFENPRRIKHSINRLVTLRTIAQERENEGILSPGRITDNTPFLAKISILEEEFPEFYSKLVSDPYLLEDINSYFNNEITGSDKRERIESIVGVEERGESRLEAFLRSTRRVTAQNARPFLTLAEQSYSSGLENSDEIMRYLKTGKYSELRTQVKDIRERDESFVQYCDAVDDELRSYKMSGRDQPMYSIIDSLVAIFVDLKQDERERVAEVVGRYLVTDPGRGFVDYLDPITLFPVMVEMPDWCSQKLFRRFAGKVGGDSEKKILEAFTNHAEKIPETAVDILSNSVSELEDEGVLEDSLKLLAGSDSSKKHLVTSEVIEASLSLVEIDESENEYVGTGNYTQFEDVSGPELRGSYIEKLLDLREGYTRNQENQLNQSLTEKLKSIETNISESAAERLLKDVQDLVKSQKNVNVELVESCIRFYDSFSDDTVSSFDQWFTELFRQWNQQDVKQVFEFTVENKVPVLKIEEQVDALFDRIPGQISNEEFVVSTVIPRIPVKFDSKIVNKTKELVRNNNNQYRSLGLKIIEEHPDRLEDSFGSIIEQCGGQANRENNTNVKKQLLMPIAKQFSDLDGPEQENFIDQMENLLRGNAGDYGLYQELWNEFAEDADDARQDAVMGDVLEELDQRISNQNPDHLALVNRHTAVDLAMLRHA